MNTLTKPLSQRNVKITLFICLAILFKLIPHLPNFNPEIVFSIYFLIHCKRHIGLLVTILMWSLCDIAFALIYHVPAFGFWTFFTYSALFIYALVFSVLRVGDRYGLFVIATFCGSLSFWVWTNLGVWLLSGMYPHALSGLITCYVLALPFLGYSLSSSLFWSIAISFLRSSTRVQFTKSKMAMV